MAEDEKSVTLFLCGDVMTGRGVDQVMPHPSDPAIHERYMKSARGYVKLATDAHGSIPEPVEPDYVWGDALDEFERFKPAVKLANLETAITQSDDDWQGKGVHYRMHPQNIGCLTVADIDVCTLANNHVLDWGYAGLSETIETLREAGIYYTGAGANLSEAQVPSIIEAASETRVVTFGLGFTNSGIPADWGAGSGKSGVNLFDDFSQFTLNRIREMVEGVKKEGDIIVASIHWGPNWGYEIPLAYRNFAHQLMDQAGIDLIHGHSSHHVKGIEVYNHRLVLYGCGDFINDYEGIQGYDQYRDDLGLMYFPRLLTGTGELVGMEMVPTRLRRFQVHKSAPEEAEWLLNVLNHEGERLGTRFDIAQAGRLRLLVE